jgi:hypothetical protein
MKSTKFQAPTSREAPNFKIQLGMQIAHFEAWCLEFLWSLDVGAWCFPKLMSFVRRRHAR